MGILRSATAARIYAKKYNTRSAGTWEDALIPLTPTLLAWADEVVFVNNENYAGALKRFGQEALNEVKYRTLAISDRYPHMHPDLIREFEEQYEQTGTIREAA
jgi:predicted protein tyrosine phosphatase